MKRKNKAGNEINVVIILNKICSKCNKQEKLRFTVVKSNLVLYLFLPITIRNALPEKSLS